MPERNVNDGEPGKSPSETLEATLERVVYTNTESGWSVVRLMRENDPVPLTAVGNLHGAQPGECLRLSGDWVDDTKYGRQFKVQSFLALEPTTLDGIRKFLGSGLITGIGPAMAARLVERFGLDALEIIEHEPERLREVEGIGPVRAAKIKRAYLEQRELRDAMVFLQGYGVSARLAVRICQRYGDSTVATLRENPYRLAAEMFGVGFKTADRIASSLGFEETSPQRVRAGLLHTLGQAADDGHIYLPRGRLLSLSADLLGVAEQLCAEALESLVAEARLVAEPLADRPAARAIYTPELHRAEIGIVADVERLLAAQAEPAEIKVDKAIEWFEERQGLEFARLQREAIRRGLVDRMVIITGGPGTGKTTLVRAITEILRRKNQRLLLAAPTGRAANRLAEATGPRGQNDPPAPRVRPASPRLPARPGAASRCRRPDRRRGLDARLLADPSAAGALPSGSRLVLLGDADQLPSVGPGRVLHDLIAAAAASRSCR